MDYAWIFLKVKTYRWHSKNDWYILPYSAFTPHSVDPVEKTQNGTFE